MNTKQNIYWIGGSPCSGKSSIAELLCQKFGFTYYKCDDHLERYLKIGLSNHISIMEKFSRMTLDETWIERNIGEQVEDEIAFYRASANIILDDVNTMIDEKGLVVEGAAITPEFIVSHNIDFDHYVCIVPTKAFQIDNYKKRDWAKEYLKSTSQPQLAFENWMARDASFAMQISKQARENNMNIIVVDGSKSIQDNYDIVVEMFGLRK